MSSDRSSKLLSFLVFDGVHFHFDLAICIHSALRGLVSGGFVSMCLHEESCMISLLGNTTAKACQLGFEAFTARIGTKVVSTSSSRLEESECFGIGAGLAENAFLSVRILEMRSWDHTRLGFSLWLGTTLEPPHTPTPGMNTHT